MSENDLELAILMADSSGISALYEDAGESVNKAARLSSTAKPGELLVSGRFLESSR